MLFACAAGIVAGTDSPAETKPGSDNYAVKVPVSDGSRDVTAAFLDALKAHGRVYVPEGMYRIDSRVDLSRLYGPGILTFNTGHEVALTTPADSETLDQMFFADLKYAVEKVGVQDMSVCGGAVFLSQNVRNPGWSDNRLSGCRNTRFQDSLINGRRSGLRRTRIRRLRCRPSLSSVSGTGRAARPCGKRGGP